MPRVAKRSSKAIEQGSPLPHWVPPQLTQLTDAAPSGPRWLHEIKLDGFRMSARIEGGRARLLTRTGLDWSDKYPSVVAALEKVQVKAAYLDGELCGVGDDGLPSFSQIQSASDGKRDVRLVYYAFDLLHLDGRDTKTLPLIERKALLEPLIAGTSGLQFNGHETGDGETVRKHACKLGFEGVVSKTVDAPYAPGNGGLWRKSKCLNRQEFVVVGWTDPEGSRPCLGALLLGYYSDDGKLIYAGRVGTGMPEKVLKDLRRRLESLARVKSPLSAPPPRKTRFGSPLVLSQVHWVEPQLVAEITYLAWTADGLLRQTVYVGLRSDKTAGQVRVEVARGRASAGTVDGQVALPTAEKSVRRPRARRQSQATSAGDPMLSGRPLLVIDGDSFAHRSYHALPKTIRRSDGEGAGAILGFANFLLRFYTDEQPRAVVVGWDSLDAPTKRREMFPAYQSGRQFDDELVEQLNVLPEFVAACGFVNAKTPGFEADDFLAAAVAAEERGGGSALVASGDRDSFQLASPSTTILYPMRAGEIARIGPDEVRKRYGVDPKQVPDFIALRGDPSDKLPGASGVGPKRAAALLRRYGSLDGVLKAGLFRSQVEMLRLYRLIATMDASGPLPSLANQSPTWLSASNLARRWKLNQLADRLGGMA
jgi:bifunctional non-homologous end joining protein LigD